MNETPPLDDRQARLDALDIRRSFIVQAPAGSGKTELLIQRYLHLLASVNEPEEIVAITFTRKAAQEMRQRIVTALHGALHGDQAIELHKKVTLRAARKVLQRDADSGWQLLQLPRRMRIQTLDAFNARITRSLPLSSGIGGIDATRVGAEMQLLYRQAATATLDWLGSNDDMGDVVEKVLSHLDNNTTVYIAHLARMLQSRDQWLALIGSGTQSDRDLKRARQTLEQGIESVITAQLQRTRAQIPDGLGSDLAALVDYAAANRYREGKRDDPLTRLRGITELPGCAVTDREGWQSIGRLLLTRKGDFRKKVTVADGFPANDNGEKQTLINLIGRIAPIEGFANELRSVGMLPPPRYDNDQWHILVSLLRLLPQAVAELQRLFSERSVCDHIEVALATARALGSPDCPGDLSLRLDHRIRHLLVDEMQDTSLRQYQLLQQLTAGWMPDDGKTVFCVGDPMQSIYRFRDAEVGQFILARDKGIGSLKPESLILRRNFRSSAHLVHWFNTTFRRVMPIHDDINAGAIAYCESIPVGQGGSDASATVYPLVNCDSAAEARFSAGLVARCVAEHAKDTVAVLVRSRAQLNDLLIELRGAGIPFQAVEIDRLTDLPEIIDLLALTRAMCHQADRCAWLGLLHGPLVGICWKDIHSLVVNDSSRTVEELLAEDERLRTLSDDAVVRLTSFVETVKAFRATAAVTTLRDRVERCWYELGGPGTLPDADQLANVYRYFDVLEKIETVGTLADVGELESLIDQERVSSTAEGDCTLQIMTMHKCKGLQFDHVFIPALGSKTRPNQKSVLNWLTIPGGQPGSMLISPVGPRATPDGDPLQLFIEATEKHKQKHELDRLLYVACTRAKKSLHLIGNVNSGAGGSDRLRPPAAGCLLQRLWPAVEPLYKEAFAKHAANQPAATGRISERLREPLARRFSPPWQAGAGPRIELPLGISDSAGSETEEAVPFYWVGALARHAGTIVHRWLQQIATSSEFQDRVTDREQQRQVSKQWARQLGVSEFDLETVCVRVSMALEGALGDEKGRWLLAGEGHAELPLTGLWNGEVASVVIDRVRIDEHGTHWIVDYKISAHQGGDPAGFLAREVDRYRPQLKKYAGIYSAITDARVRTALYFPLLQKFCEVA